MDKENLLVKPLSMLKEDFINALTELINTSHLPPFVVEYVLRDVVNDVHIVAERQLERETASYNKQISGCNDAQKD